MQGSESKSISKVLADFSKKFARFSESSLSEQAIKKESPLKALQEQINERENERILFLRRQLQEYIAPLTSDIEEDEEALIRAYKLYCMLVDTNKELGDPATHLKDSSIVSPICKKSEYTSLPGRFPFLRLWFLIMNPDSLFIPELRQSADGEFLLNFLEKDLWQPTGLEKEIMQANLDCDTNLDCDN